MGALLDIIELLIGFIVIPRIISILLILLIGIGANIYVSLIVPIVLLLILTYFLFNKRRLIGYGMILAILSNIIDLFLINLENLTGTILA